MIADRVRQYRQRCQLSQGALARAMGLAPNAISKIEHGHRKVTLDEALKFATIFGVPLQEFVGAVVPSPPPAATLLAHQCVAKVQAAELALKAVSQAVVALEHTLSWVP